MANDPDWYVEKRNYMKNISNVINPVIMSYRIRKYKVGMAGTTYSSIHTVPVRLHKHHCGNEGSNINLVSNNMLLLQYIIVFISSLPYLS